MHPILLHWPMMPKMDVGFMIPAAEPSHQQAIICFSFALQLTVVK